MEEYRFDERYLARLKARDRETEAHFIEYFNTMLKAKLRRDGYSETAIHNIRQESLYRVLRAAYEDKIHHPESLRSFAYGVCARVCWEFDQGQKRDGTGDSKEELEVSQFEARSTVRWILERLPEKERKMLVALFVEQRDRDEICREFGVDRTYLRTLVHRALLSAKKVLARSGLS